MPTQTISRCGGSSGGAALLETILASNVKALYKLDESAGNTAADSSGNGYDATTYGARVAPAWAQAAGPPGTTSAYFSQSPSLAGLRNTAFPSLSGDWTILGWFKQDGDIFTYCAGQGIAVEAGAQGFGLSFHQSNGIPPSRAVCYVGKGAGAPSQVNGDNILAPGNWYMLAATRSGTTVTLYVDGAAQSTPGTPAYVASSGTSLGNNQSNFGMRGWESWVGYWDAALTAVQIAAIYNAASI